MHKVTKKKLATPVIKPERIIPSTAFPYLKRAGQKVSAFFKAKR